MGEGGAAVPLQHVHELRDLRRGQLQGGGQLAHVVDEHLVLQLVAPEVQVLPAPLLIREALGVEPSQQLLVVERAQPERPQGVGVVADRRERALHGVRVVLHVPQPGQRRVGGLGALLYLDVGAVVVVGVEGEQRAHAPVELRQLAGDGAHQYPEAALMAHVAPDGLALVPPAALDGVGAGQGGHVRGRHGEHRAPPASADRGLEEGHRGSERIEVDVVEGPLREQDVHVPARGLAVLQAVQLYVALYPRGRAGRYVVGHDLGAGHLVRDAHGAGAGGGHGGGDAHRFTAQRSQEHDADVAVERHLLVEEDGPHLLAGTVGGVVLGDQDVRGPLADDRALGAQMFSPLMSLTIL